jgi:prepilin-type N-terminal cleavage/methylation domain-containing protein
MIRYHTGRTGFTLIELLVVIAILMVLASMLMPLAGRTIEMARQVTCRNNLRQMGQACLSFSSDHDGYIPVGSEIWQWFGPEPWQRCWIGQEVLRGPNDKTSNGWPIDKDGKRYYGSILDYIGGVEMAKRIYRCPSLEEGELFSGIGSNGRFDYTMTKGFTGLRLGEVPLHAKVTIRGREQMLPTPMIVEEDPYIYLNSSHIEPGHGNLDRIGTWHEGKGFYVSFDGSVQRLDGGGQLLPAIRQWRAKAPSGKWQHIGGSAWNVWRGL